MSIITQGYENNQECESRISKFFHLSGCRSSNDIEPRKKLIVENERRNLSQRRTA